MIDRLFELNLGRRDLLKGAAIGVAASAASCAIRACPIREELPTKSDTRYLADIEHDTFATMEDVENPPALDLDYLKYVISYLENPKGTTESRINEIKENLYRTGSGSTTLMIDEGGIFIAAGHSYGVLPAGKFEPIDHFFLTWMMNPVKQKSYLVTHTVLHPDVDTAIIYAPTGKPFRALPVQLNFSVVPAGRDLWSFGVTKARTQDREVYAFSTLYGQMSPTALSEAEKAYNDQFRIDNMIPFGGMSGAPIFDREGVIVGTVSGGIESIPGERSPYIGTRAASIRGIRTLIDNLPGSLYTIPGLSKEG